MSERVAVDHLWINVTAATMQETGAPYGLVTDAAVAVSGSLISFVGSRMDVAAAFDARQTHDGEGGLLTPGLIDCHTHLVYGANRAREFEMRLQGATYEDIARAGGGIMSSVRATRLLDEAALVAAALPRLDALLAEGVTTVEVKSGYGLDLVTELRLLRAARRLGADRQVTVRTTLLAAHAVPPEFMANSDGYVDLVCDAIIPGAAREGLADAVDAFCEGIAFSPRQVRQVFECAHAHGLPVKLHAEQLSSSGGAALAAELGALSADHLEHLDAAGVAAMAAAGTVAVLLPGAFYFLREQTRPPVALLRDAGVPMALATDCNPGTSPLTSLLLVLNMACTLFRLTPEEAFAGITRHAARALGLPDRGVLAPGLRADLVLWRINHPSELAYSIGFNPVAAVMRGGILRSLH